MKSLPRRVAVLIAAVAGLLIAGTGVASAHVTVAAPGATAGGSAQITFTVPTESDTASTVKLQVQLPKNAPIASVSVKPVPGWTASTTTTHLAQPVKTDDGDTVTDVVSQITWTADAGQGIAPGQYQTFSISAGPLPKADSLAFPAIQTYSDGTQVAWIDPTVAGQPEPQHPAPVVHLTGSTPSTQTASAGTASGGGSGGVEVAALVVAIVALVAALAALGLAIGGRRRGRAGGPSAGSATTVAATEEATASRR